MVAPAVSAVLSFIARSGLAAAVKKFGKQIVDNAIEAGKTGKVGILMEIEGPAMWLNGNINVLKLLYRLGVRSIHITHGEGGSAVHELELDKRVSISAE